MKNLSRIIGSIGAVGMLISTGCLHIQPIGPLAHAQGLPSNPPPIGSKAAAEATRLEPILREAPKPTPPAMYVTPGEITATNADEAMKRLQQELETDRRITEAMPRYAEISIVK